MSLSCLGLGFLVLLASIYFAVYVVVTLFVRWYGSK